MPGVHHKFADRRRDLEKAMQNSKKAEVHALSLLIRVPPWEARESCCPCLGHSLPVGSWQVRLMLRGLV